jgi:hypothetical protein
MQQSENQLNLVESRLRELDAQVKHLREMLEVRLGSKRQNEGTLKQDEAALKKDEAPMVPTPTPTPEPSPPTGSQRSDLPPGVVLDHLPRR